jgi:hypothetical protein
VPTELHSDDYFAVVQAEQLGQLWNAGLHGHTGEILADCHRLPQTPYQPQLRQTVISGAFALLAL